MKNQFLFLCVLFSASISCGQIVSVNGNANIFGAGHSTPPAPEGGGAGTLPPSITLGVGNVFTFSTTGSITYNSGGNYYGAEGAGFGGGSHYSSIGGISGIQHGTHRMFLIGVFTNGTEPSGGGPPVLDFTNDSFASVSPLLNQTFFIGDGLTGRGSGSVQFFYVPSGATRLFLGFADGNNLPGTYADNSGTVTVTANQFTPSNNANLSTLNLSDGGTAMVYVSNANTNTIAKFDSAGNGSVFASGLNNPVGLAVDAAGNIYVANSSHSSNTGSIWKFTPGGVSSVFASSGLDFPTGLAFDTSGNLYAANSQTAVIKRFSPAGGVGTVFVADPGNNSVMWSPYGIAFDSGGNLYAANFTSQTIEKFTTGGVASLFANAGVVNPEGLAFDAADNLYVANYGDNTVRKYTPGGVGSVFANTGLHNPAGIAFDGSGNLYAVNQNTNTVEKFSPTGVDLGVFASTGLDNPTFIAITPDPARAIFALSPSFDSATTNYTSIVSYAKTTVTVTPTVSDSTAKVRVNGASVVSGTATRDIPLSVGANTLTTVVTAQDGTTKTYTVTVTRLPPPAPEIEVRQPSFSIIADGGIKDFGAVAVNGNKSLVFTIKNTGDADLTGLGITFDGADSGLFSVTAPPVAPVSAPTGSTTFTVQFAPTTAGPKIAALHIANNDPDENPYDITLLGNVSAQEVWRQTNFGSIQNSGDGADLNDYDRDGLVNLTEFAFGLNPKQNSAGQLPQGQVIGPNYVLFFNQPAGVSGITYGAEWSNSLLPLSWTPIPDTGFAPQHVFSVPIGSSSSMFVRLKVTSP